MDDQPVSSVVRFLVARPYRRRGVADRRLRAAVDYAWKRGARIVEGYPVEPKNGGVSGAMGYLGLASTFRKAGFVEVAGRSETRPIMRYITHEG